MTIPRADAFRKSIKHISSAPCNDAIPSLRCAGRGGDSSSDFTDLEEEEDDDEPQPKKPSKPRAPRLANLYKNGNQGGRGSAEDAGAAKEGGDDEMAASDHFWHGLSKKVKPVFLAS